MSLIMENIKRHIIKILALSTLAIHLTIHLLYLAPINPITKNYQSKIEKYMDPLFTQNWHLFAPEPAIASLKINYRCHPNDEWTDLITPLFKKHKSTLITAVGKETYVYQHLARQIYNQDSRKENILNSPDYVVLSKVITDQCKNQIANQSEFQIVREFTVNFSERNNPQLGQLHKPHIIQLPTQQSEEIYGSYSKNK